jgi:hypothetical protein
MKLLIEFVKATGIMLSLWALYSLSVILAGYGG